ncbi:MULTISPECIES: transcription antitermination factor NusB [unclassified Leifsonia]|uniref:RsmB/NOP family class I SAM-dependent RNA methyltransferase n=1 Tax=unclassified Leifsonia TaxID=2663824 RepID=UPI0008A741F5|nr:MULTISPECIES: transcription antitermination factor NusB [unclassified Leifsonia]SEH94322.1 16S rRNA (cytosine967-C5)-methyltransferase [Leifsonia sp. CL154]SFL59022.1 16S rRNA (cytosine967-C5)-methyltransferase [Leifsonia sp. CL147]
MNGRPSQIRVQPARQVALDVLQAVRESDAYANLLLPTRIARADLSPADAGLATELTYGTLRMQGFYDRVIEIAAGRGVDRIDPPLLDVLRLGAHQLLSMRVAAHAAVNESVALARTVGSRSGTGFVNGVLREIGRHTTDEWREEVAGRAGNDDDRLSALSSHPVWVLRAFRRALEAEGRRDELPDLLQADNAAPRVNLIALPGLADLPPDARADRYSPPGFTVGRGDPLGMMDESGGRIRVQDEGSQLAALTLSRAQPIQPGERWLDLCAGPGGKAALLAAEALAGGASLVANELIPVRADLVRRALAAVPLEVPVWELDGTTIGEAHPEAFDRILLDAPCTGLGALRRRPEARWRKTPRDVADLTGLQSALLDSAIAALKPGGLLAYVTCSPHLAETRGIVADALERHAYLLEPEQTATVVQGLASERLDLAGDPETVQLWPHRHLTDAMFIALLRKRSA